MQSRATFKNINKFKYLTKLLHFIYEVQNKSFNSSWVFIDNLFSFLWYNYKKYIRVAYIFTSSHFLHQKYFCFLALRSKVLKFLLITDFLFFLVIK